MFRFLILILLTKGSLFGKITAEKDQKLRLAQIFTDHCVLQRDMPTPIWGKAAPKTPVKVLSLIHI